MQILLAISAIDVRALGPVDDDVGEAGPDGGQHVHARLRRGRGGVHGRGWGWGLGVQVGVGEQG